MTRIAKVRVVLAALIAGSTLPALAEPIYVWRPSEGAKAGQILPADAFTISTPPVTGGGGGVDFRSKDYGKFAHYTTRSVALAVGDLLTVSVPSVFGGEDCQLLSNTANRYPDQWVLTSTVGLSGKYSVAIRAKAAGRLELTVGCLTNRGGDVETMFQEYLSLTIS